MPSRKELLSQVFLRAEKLVASLVERSSINKNDVVVEIGPGEGIITTELAKRAGKVVAIEKDPGLYHKLKEKFRNTPNVELRLGDALETKMPVGRHKVFANPPFAIEGKLIRKLIESENPPEDTYLVMREGVAERMAGVPKEGQFSVLHKPRFNISILYRFRRSDFEPKPMVESVMIRFQKREQPLVAEEDHEAFTALVEQGFGDKGRRIGQKLKPLVSHGQLKQLARKHGFGVNDKPSDLTLDQWLGIFNFVKGQAK